MSAIVVHTPQTLRSRLVWAVVFCVAVNLIAALLRLPLPIVTTAQVLTEVVPPFLQGLQEAIGVIRAAASK